MTPAEQLLSNLAAAGSNPVDAVLILLRGTPVYWEIQSLKMAGKSEYEALVAVLDRHLAKKAEGAV